MIVICGLHRSGTTYVGEILKKAGVMVVHEPLNQHWGVKDIPMAYPYAEYLDDNQAPLIKDVVAMNRPWNNDISRHRGKCWEKIAFGITGGRSGLLWSALRMRKSLGLPCKRICFKDPFMSLATPWLAEHALCRIVCMVRHPAAVFYSTEKQDWYFDVKNLRQQTMLVERYGQDITADNWTMAEKHGAASIALLWKLMWNINSQLAAREERLKIITHESLCVRPIEEVQIICDHFDVHFSSEVETFVLTHSEGDKTEAKRGITHDFKRYSRGIPDSWRGKIKEDDESIIKEIVGKEVIALYGDW